MPPRAEEELDAVSLHNQALMNMEANATGGFQKMQFLLQQNPFPPETFGNLLLLYVKYEVSDGNCFACHKGDNPYKKKPT
jgi:tetratricopeptide repeat protein 30